MGTHLPSTLRSLVEQLLVHSKKGTRCEMASTVLGPTNMMLYSDTDH